MEMKRMMWALKVGIDIILKSCSINWYRIVKLFLHNLDDEIVNKFDDSAPEKNVLDWNNLKWKESVGKRKDCIKMIYTIDEYKEKQRVCN